MKKIKVAFPIVDQSWIGGFNYITNLIQAIQNLPDRKIEPVLLVSRSLIKKVENNFSDLKIVETSLFTGYGFFRILSKACEFFFKRNFPLERLLNKHDVKILSHAVPLGRDSKILSICWIPDFQHFRLPQYFSSQQIRRRNINFKRMIQSSSLILVSSLSAQRDLEEFEPRSINRSKVLNFISTDTRKIKMLTAKELKLNYNLSQPFFYLPNQFWKHKNHKVVIDALIELSNEGLNIKVVCTGSSYDFRHPKYFGELQKYLKNTGQQKNFHVLGVLPKSHALSLMYHSMAVINPSFFEGWSTTVEEAKVFGKTILLSDILVHKEQNPNRGIYFSPRSSIELAKVMKKVFNTFDLKKENYEKKKSQGSFENIFLKFGYSYQKIVIDLLSKSKSF